MSVSFIGSLLMETSGHSFTTYKFLRDGVHVHPLHEGLQGTGPISGFAPLQGHLATLPSLVRILRVLCHGVCGRLSGLSPR